MSLFSNILPTFLNKTGEWIDGVFNTPVKPTATIPTSGSTSQFAQGKDVIGNLLSKGINLIKTQFQKSQQALATPVPGSEQLVKGGITVDPTGLLGMENVAETFGKIAISKSPEIISGLLKEANIIKTEIPALAKKLVSITNPEEVKNIIEPFIQKAPQTIKALGGEILQSRQPKDYIFSDQFGGSVSATIKGNKAEIYDAFAKEKGHAVFENAIKDLSDRGINTIEVNLQTVDTQGAINSMVKRGILTNPRGGDPRVIGGGYPTKFDIIGAKTKSQLTDLYKQAVGGLTPKTPQISPKIAPEIERGFITSVKEAYPEMKVAGQYIPRETDTLAIKAKNLIKDDIMSAEAQARTGTDDNAVAIASELIKHYGDEAAKATNTATKVALNDKAAEIANNIAHKLTESGRSVQAASILGRLTPEGQVRFAAREIQKYNEMIDSAKGGIFGLKKKIPELTGNQADEIVTEMKAINTMADGEEKAIRFQSLQDRISKLIPSSLYQKVVAVWKAGLLTGLKTTGVNLFSNASHFGSEILKDIPATAVDKVASLFTGERTLALSMKSKEGIKEGFNKGLRYLKTGYDERNIATKLDYHKVNFGNSAIGRGLQKYEETVFGLMGAEDQPFYYGAKARSLYNQAKAQAINKRLKGTEAQKFIDNLVSNPTDKMLAYAVGDAETAVFQNQTILGNIAKSIQRAPGGELVLPFGRTPAAVATQIINYSPVGIAKTIFENLGKGRFDQRLFAQGIGRGLTGTAVMAIGATAFAKGLVALDRPTSEKEQKLWELEGRKANTFYDPISKKWRSVQVLGPAGNVLLIGAHFQDALQKAGSPTEAMSIMAFGSLKSFSEQTFLTGINQVTSALSDPQRSAPAYAGSILSSTIPTLLSDIARSTDTKERRSESILQKFEARVPGLREMLQPQVNVLGKEIDTVGNPIEIMADPTRPSPSSDSPIVAEFRRLWNNGFKVSPTLLGDKAGFQGLTQEQNTELWKRAGDITQSKITSLLSKNEYWNFNDEQKANIISDITDKSKLMARVEMVLQLTDGLNGQELLTKLSELKKGGLLTSQVYNEYQRLR